MEMFNVVINWERSWRLWFDKLYPFKPGKSPLEVITSDLAIMGKSCGCNPPYLSLFLNWMIGLVHFHNSISVAIMLITYGIAFIWKGRTSWASSNGIIASLSNSSSYRTTSKSYRYFRNKPFRCYDCRWLDQWLAVSGDRIYLLFGIPAMFGASLWSWKIRSWRTHSLTLGQLFILLVAMGWPS